MEEIEIPGRMERIIIRRCENGWIIERFGPPHYCEYVAADWEDVIHILKTFVPTSTPEPEKERSNR